MQTLRDVPDPVRRAAFAAAIGLGLIALYWGALRAPFLNDDYLFLEEARTRPLAQSLFDLGALGNYWRPLSRQIWFEALTPIAGGHPLVFHLASFAVFLAALALLWDLLRALVPRPGAVAGLLYFATLPFQRVNLLWISCSQDLLALAGALGAIALHRRGRAAWGLVAALAAFASKESALPLPLALLGWDRWVAGRSWGESLRRAAPTFALALAWVAALAWVRGRHEARTPLDLGLGAFAAGFAHLGQSLLGLDHPAGFVQGLLAHAPAFVPLGCFVLAIVVAPGGFGRRRVAGDGAAPPPPGAFGAASPVAARAALAFALWWLAAFALPTGPVSYAWSSYYYTLAAAGGAILVGLACARADRWLLAALATVLLWWHAGGISHAAFSVERNRWTWTSHLTPFYFERAARLVDTLSTQLVRLVPDPPPRSRFYFATLPSWAAFHMGNGALIRALYRDTTLTSHFYSQFSDSTLAGGTPHFLWWDGAELTRLYGQGPDTWFQVGADLLLLDRPAGALDAFRHGMRAGGVRMDLLYWSGWAQLWLGDRAGAERTWTTFGAVEDSLYWRAHLRAAHNALVDGDTIEARGHLVKAIEFGIGRPEGHAVLGELMLAQRGIHTKYGLMELKVASWLDPRDWVARRHYALGLDAVGLNDVAAREITALVRDFPRLEADSAVARVWREHAAAGERRVVTAGRGGTR